MGATESEGEEKTERVQTVDLKKREKMRKKYTKKLKEKDWETSKDGEGLMGGG